MKRGKELTPQKILERVKAILEKYDPANQALFVLKTSDTLNLRLPNGKGIESFLFCVYCQEPKTQECCYLIAAVNFLPTFGNNQIRWIIPLDNNNNPKELVCQKVFKPWPAAIVPYNLHEINLVLQKLENCKGKKMEEKESLSLLKRIE